MSAHGDLYFRGLPRELRDQIFRDLLVVPGGIHIQQPRSHQAARPITPMHLALLCTNKQTYQEASQILFKENVLTLDISVVVAVEWLTDFIKRPEIMSLIKTITLGKNLVKWYTGIRRKYHLSNQLTEDLWNDLIYRVGVSSISIQLPDPVPGSRVLPQGFRLPLDDMYCWTTFSKSVVDIMMVDDQLQELRFLFPTHMDEAVDIESMHSIKELRRAEDEFSYQSREKRVRQAYARGHRTEFKSEHDMEQYLRSQRRVHDFSVTCETGETGTILVLRKPKPVAQGLKRSYAEFKKDEVAGS